MDDATASSPARTTPPPASSPDDQLNPRARKKPRLDALDDAPATLTSASSSRATPSSSQSSASASDTLERTSSHLASKSPPGHPASKPKVTLNLRTAPPQRGVSTAVAGTNGMAANDHDAGIGLQEGEPQLPTQYMDITPDLPSFDDGGDPPVVNVTLSDEETSVADSNSGLSDQQLFAKFPRQYSPSRYDSAETALKHLCDRLTRDEDGITTEDFSRVGDWLNEWLENHDGPRNSWTNLYSSNMTFWNSLGTYFTRLAFEDGKLKQAKYTAPVIDTIVRDTITDYIRLSLQIACAEFDKLGEALAADAKDLHFKYLDHLANISQFLRFFDESSFWSQLQRKHKVDTAAIRRQIAQEVVQDSSIIGLVQLPVICSSRAASCPQLGQAIPAALNAVEVILHASRGTIHASSTQSSHDSSRRQTLCSAALNAVQEIEENLLRAVELQASLMSHDLYQKSVKACKDVTFVASFPDQPTDPISDSQNTPAVPNTSRSIALCLNLAEKIYLKFIAKGRMELRVRGVQELGELLVDLFNRNQHNPELFREATETTLELLSAHRLVQYLVSVDSHPELISRACNIFGFLMIHAHWQQSHTEAVIAAIHHGQDARSVTAVIAALGKSVGHACPPVLLDLLSSIADTPSSCLTEELLMLLQSLKSLVVERVPEREVLYGHLHRMMVRSCEPTALGQISRMRLLERLGEMLREVDEMVDSRAGRQELFELSQNTISDLSPASTGSVHALGLLLANHPGHIQDLLPDESGILESICQSLNAYAREMHGAAQDAKPDFRFVLRLRLLCEIFKEADAKKVSRDLRSRLWSILVGSQAVNTVHRVEAWGVLKAVSAGYQDGLVDAFALHDLPLLPSHLFSGGAVDFTREHAKRQWLSRDRAETEDGSVIGIPQSVMLWRFILEAPSQDEAVAREAIACLVEFYADARLPIQYPPSTVSATHSAFVEQCLQILRQTAAALVEAQTDKDADDQLLPKANGLQFARTLGLMLQFLRLIRHEVRFMTDFAITKSPSPELVREVPVKGEIFPLRYQICDSKSQSELQSLMIGQDNTYEDLDKMLRDILPFREMRLIQSARRLDLSSNKQERVAPMENAGLLLIQNIEAPSDSSPPTSLKTASTIAESSVLAHFEELYEYLSLDQGLDRHTFDFLTTFEYPDFAIKHITSGTATKESMFPSDKPFKSMYELRSLKAQLRRSTHDATSYHRQILVIAQFLLRVTSSTSDGFNQIEDPGIREWVTLEFFDTVSHFLSELGRIDANTPLELKLDDDSLVNDLFDLLHKHSLGQSPHPQQADLISLKIYSVLKCLVVRDQAYWQSFSDYANARDIHKWLLVSHPNPQFRDQIRMSLEYLLHEASWASAHDYKESTKHFWNLLSPLVPVCVEEGMVSQPFFHLLASHLIPNASSDEQHRESSADTVGSWFELLLHTRKSSAISSQSAEGLELGLALVLSAAIETGLVSESVFDDAHLILKLFKTTLFPDVTNEAAQPVLSVNQNQPVLESIARQKLVELVLALCRTPETLNILVEHASGLTTEKINEALAYDEDRDLLLRSSAGFSGLRNLTNTCYMNSLLAQLFMIPKFRQFMLNVPSVKDSKLVNATKRLFANMMSSQRKYADTADFALAVVPYDAPQIDVSIQMDVDEFYNLLFDRWESQMPGGPTQTEFRSLFGGKMMNQVKSLDCEHVSERQEEYMTISCEVKGKFDLFQSLQAYIEGDTMEGDNKYKCDSCGGRFVNAVKRTCLQEVPENLIFHLKRFDFDLTTLQRSKINDYFAFPFEIDMAPYKYESVNEQLADAPPDIFELVGVLVHAGNAEAGHYYSFIKDPRDAKKWLEFNDVDVTDFEPNKIPDLCFGGTQGYSNSAKWPKTYNAYMLFYQRRGMVADESKEILAESMSMNGVLSNIKRDNDLVTRWYGLLDSSYAYFVRETAAKLRQMVGKQCSQYHQVEISVAKLGLDYLHQVASRSRDTGLFESVFPAIEKLVLDCGSCCAGALEWLAGTESTMGDLILRCPSSEVRRQIASLLVAMLRVLKRHCRTADVEYGLELDERKFLEYNENTAGILPRLMASLKKDVAPDLAQNGARWDELFMLLQEICVMGVGECQLLLEQEIFLYATMLMYTSDPPMATNWARTHEFYKRSADRVSRLKRQPSFTQVTSLVALFLPHLRSWWESTSVEQILTDAERDLVGSMTLQDGDRVYPFLIKAMHGLDQPDRVDALSRFVRFMVEDLPREHIRKVEVTIAKAIQDQTPDLNIVGLRAAQEYFKHCESAAQGGIILETVTKESSTLDTEGQSAALDFFATVAQLTNVKCAEPESSTRPFLGAVLQRLPRWGISVLGSEEYRTRVHAVTLIRELVVKELWDVLRSGERQPSTEDLKRSEALEQLSGECCEYVTKGMETNQSKSTLMELYEMTDLGLKWYKRLLEKAEDAAAWKLGQAQVRERVMDLRQLKIDWDMYDAGEAEEASASEPEQSMASDGANEMELDTEDDSEEIEVDSNMTDQFQVGGSA